MRLKTHSRTSERPGYEARKNAKTRIEGNADTIRRQTTRQNLPRTASVAGGARRKRRYGRTNHRQNPPAYCQRGGGGRDEERRTEVELRHEDNGNQSQNPPAGYHRGGGARQEAKTNTKWKGGTIHSPAKGRGAKLKTHLKRENKTTCITKKRRQKIQSCATV